MKILLIMKMYTGSEKVNKFPKFNHQIEALRNMGHDVNYIGIEDNCISYYSKDNKITLYNFKNMKTNNTAMLYTYHIIYKSMIKLIKMNIFHDILYLRYSPVSIGFKKAIMMVIKSGCRIVCEIPTHPVINEIKSEKRIVRKLFMLFTLLKYRSVSKKIDLFAIIGNHDESLFGRPAINIDNGITYSYIRKRNYYNDTNKLHVLLLANFAKWHGYDRLITGMQNYVKQSDYPIEFHFVGPDDDGSLKQWRAMVEKLGLNEYFKFEGPLYDKDLEIMFDKCAIAIDSLGMHRVNISTSSSLKIRQFMARGIPFVLAVPDLSLLPNLEFYTIVDSNDQPINIPSIIDFANIVNEKNYLSDLMIEYAKQHMSWEAQFDKIFKILGEK